MNHIAHQMQKLIYVKVSKQACGPNLTHSLFQYGPQAKNGFYIFKSENKTKQREAWVA